MSLAATVYTCGVLSVAWSSPAGDVVVDSVRASSYAPTGITATTVSQTTDEKSAKWMESFRRDLMRDNYDYEPHELLQRATGSFASATDSRRDKADKPAASNVYRSYKHRKSPVETRTMPDIPKYQEFVSKRAYGYYTSNKPLSETQEDYADAMPMQGQKQAGQSYSNKDPDRPLDDAQEKYADGMLIEEQKQAEQSQRHGAPDKPVNGASENYHGRTRKHTQSQGYFVDTPVNSMGEDYPVSAPVSSLYGQDNSISRKDLYLRPIQQPLEENSSLTDEEFETRRQALLKSLNELEDQLSPVYVSADPRPLGAESRRGVTLSAQDTRDSDVYSYQYAELRPTGSWGRTRDADLPVRSPPRGRRGDRDRPQNEDRNIKTNNVKRQSPKSFVDPRDGIRRYKVHTENGQISNMFNLGPRYPYRSIWDEDGDAVYGKDRGDRPTNRDDRPPNRDARVPIRDDRAPNRNNRSPNRGGRPFKINSRHRENIHRSAVTESWSEAPKIPGKDLHRVRPVADDNEAIYRDVDENKYANKQSYPEVLHGDGSSAEWRSGGKSGRNAKLRYKMQPEFMIERRSQNERTRKPEDDIDVGYPEQYASRRNSELYEKVAFTESKCPCQQNTTHTPRTVQQKIHAQEKPVTTI